MLFWFSTERNGGGYFTKTGPEMQPHFWPIPHATDQEDACLVLSKITEPLERLYAERHNTAPARQQQPDYEEVRCVSVRLFSALVVLWLMPVGSISNAAQSRVDRVYFVAEMSRVGSELETIIEVEAVGLEFGHSAHARACFH
ncbi:MAG: hypothetical protein RMM98_08730 [Acidobacteriota bacterium]|nr:hypothetical protein [Blastocatellia bacterium]MDW8239688.1 hypothetical protein [Acidobacteriota bacterium]